MRINCYTDALPREISERLMAFEEQFHYPLGAHDFFRIHHPPPYTQFAQSIGNAACFIATDQDQILAAISVSIRDLLIAGTIKKSAYIFDLKLHPNNTKPFALLRILQHAQTWAEQYCDTAYAVVMDGTQKTPDQYTGRLQIPKFNKSGSLAILLFPSATHSIQAQVQSAQHYNYDHTSVETIGADLAQRSRVTPRCLSIDHDNWAIFEDTRRAKQLFQADGTEIKAAHLSHIHFNNPTHASALIQSARHLAREHNYAYLFCCLNQNQYAQVDSNVRQEAKHSRASLYTHNLDTNPEWLIHSSEI